MSALLIFNRDVLQSADLLQRCLQQITLIKKNKNIQISVDYLFHYFYLDDAIFSCFYFQTALVVPEVCITTITLKQKKKNYEMQNIYIFLVRYNLMLRILVNVLHK